MSERMSAAGRDGAQSGLAIRPLVREVGNDNARFLQTGYHLALYQTPLRVQVRTSRFEPASLERWGNCLLEDGFHLIVPELHHHEALATSRSCPQLPPCTPGPSLLL